MPLSQKTVHSLCTDIGSLGMSHQTGITANEELRKFFGTCKTENVRLVKVSIISEELSLDTWKEAKGTWEEDYDQLLLPLLEDLVPCYILYRLDSQEDENDENGRSGHWMLVSWSPDDSPVRLKMLYASTKATLRLEFGGGHIDEEFFGTSKEDISFRGYLKHKKNVAAPTPLTTAEEELAELRRTECNAEIGIDTKHQTLQGVSFPISTDAIEALQSLKDKELNYVQLSIDIEKEIVNLESTLDTPLDKLPKRVPSNHARYHLFNFKHVHEGDYMESIVFIYSMPGYDCSVKERMLYSSCKAPLVDAIENQVELEIAKKIEIGGGEELSEDFLQDELHPKQNLNRPKFAKPKGPPNRGAKRITRPSQNSAQQE